MGHDNKLGTLTGFQPSRDGLGPAKLVLPRRDDYTFGDSDLAAERLRLLAEAFAPSSRAFLERLAREPAAVAVDLGCGPGYTTALLASLTGARRTVGLDASARFIE